MKQHSHTTRVAAALAATAAIALALTACSGSTPGSGTEPTADGELTTVKVGNLLFVGTAPFRLGVEKGFFEEEGLDIVETEGDNPAALAGQLTSGQLDVAFTTIPFLATAVSEGAELRAFAAVDGVIDPDNPSSGILVAKDSAITSLADLEGKKVGVPALGSLLHLVAVADIDANGGDPEAVEMVQVPFPQMQQALETGNVDAVVSTEPFLSATLSAGAKSIGAPEADILPDATVTAWAAPLKWLESNPEAAAAFARAMNKSIEYAAENTDELLAMMPEYTGLSAEAIEEMNFGTVLKAELNTQSITDQAEMLVEFGFIKKAPALEDLVYDVGN